MEHRFVDWANLQLDGTRVAEFFRQWNLVPLEAWGAHVHREHTIGALPAIKNARGRFKNECILAALLGHEIGDAAHAVSAGTRFRAIIVIDANEGVGARRARRVQSHQLIVGCSARPRRRARADRRRRFRCRRRSSSRRTDWRVRSYRALPGFCPVYMANKRGLARAMLECAPMLANRRTAANDGEP